MGLGPSGPLRSLLETIDRFQRGGVDVEALQAAVRSAEDSVTEYELRDLRKFLQAAEGELDVIRCTVGGEQALAEALKIAKDVRARVWSTIGPGD